MRVIWLLIAEAFFVGGYATLLSLPEKARIEIIAFQQPLLLWVVPITALLAAMLAASGVVSSLIRIRQVHEAHNDYEARSTGPSTTERYPPLQDTPLVFVLARISLLGLPLLFILFWIAVLLGQIRFAT